MSEPILEIKGLNKSFGPVHVLHDVDFDVRAGEVTALVGDNGAGKSTLVKCIAGIHPYDSGAVRFLGRERGSSWKLDEASMEKAARETLASLSVRTVKSVRTPVSSLSGGQRQT